MNRFGVSTEEVLSDLKAFQRKTARYAFDRMYGDDPTPRFLVADEVGLGKTLVARGVIAQMIDEHDALGDDRIDIVYICSNAAIAAQNLRKLNVVGDDAVTRADRLTMLTSELASLHRKPVNLIAVTPGTSFNFGSGGGKFEERALIYTLLKRVWGEDAVKGSGEERVFYRGIADNRSSRKRLRNASATQRVPKIVVDAARRAISARDADRQADGKTRLRMLFKQISKDFHYKESRYPDSATAGRNEFISEMRKILAKVALDALEPDLVILDEFQRFKHLLDSESEDWATLLAQQLFNFRESKAGRQTRTLLLSATPYRPFTTAGDGQDDDHYEDFSGTIGFLLDDPAKTEELRLDLKSLRRAMLQIDPDNIDVAEAICQRIAGRLRPVMARTERLASTPDRSGMLKHLPSVTPLERHDVDDYVVASKVSMLLDQYDMTEYWKSSPYLLSFMEDYMLKKKLKTAIQDDAVPAELSRILADGAGQLDWEAITRYGEVDPANSRLRELIADTVGRGTWQLLWLPPALPYYDAKGIFERDEARTFTKRLVFSAWHVVPKAISALTSYEVERIALDHSNDDGAREYTDYAKRSGSLLAFRMIADEPAAMANMLVVTPHPSLAAVADPLRLAGELRENGEMPTLEQVKSKARGELSSLLEKAAGRQLERATADGASDRDWYWVAPLLLDLHLFEETTTNWWMTSASTDVWLGKGASGSESGADHDELSRTFAFHIERIKSVVADSEGETAKLGRVPVDLVDVLVDAALGGPANCALRSISRVVPASPTASTEARDGAARIAWGFRSLFSGILETAIVNSATQDEAYWRGILEYGMLGNIQAMLDEYLHTLGGWIGGSGSENSKLIGPLAESANEALAMRTVGYSTDVIDVGEEGVEISPSPQLRAKFAIAFGQNQSEDAQVVSRIQTVRTAFNSPFWPFVLTSTSIGQEGLDFHLYSHAIVHWNLPSNPVDFEQREGRVHRFKGHAVRKNVAFACGDAAFESADTDPWESMFLRAAELSDDPDEVKPYWVFDPEGSQARIERYVPHLPLSRDVARLSNLLKSVAAYRLSFGQPRQEELVELLTGRLDEDELERVASRLRIDLTPGPFEGVR